MTRCGKTHFINGQEEIYEENEDQEKNQANRIKEVN